MLVGSARRARRGDSLGPGLETGVLAALDGLSELEGIQGTHGFAG